MEFLGTLWAFLAEYWIISLLIYLYLGHFVESVIDLNYNVCELLHSNVPLWIRFVVPFYGPCEEFKYLFKHDVGAAFDRLIINSLIIIFWPLSVLVFVFIELHYCITKR